MFEDSREEKTTHASTWRYLEKVLANYHFPNTRQAVKNSIRQQLNADRLTESIIESCLDLNEHFHFILAMFT